MFRECYNLTPLTSHQEEERSSPNLSLISCELTVATAARRGTLQRGHPCPAPCRPRGNTACGV